MYHIASESQYQNSDYCKSLDLLKYNYVSSDIDLDFNYSNHCHYRAPYKKRHKPSDVPLEFSGRALATLAALAVKPYVKHRLFFTLLHIHKRVAGYRMYHASYDQINYRTSCLNVGISTTRRDLSLLRECGLIIAYEAPKHMWDPNKRVKDNRLIWRLDYDLLMDQYGIDSKYLDECLRFSKKILSSDHGKQNIFDHVRQYGKDKNVLMRDSVPSENEQTYNNPSKPSETKLISISITPQDLEGSTVGKGETCHFSNEKMRRVDQMALTHVMEIYYDSKFARVSTDYGLDSGRRPFEWERFKGENLKWGMKYGSEARWLQLWQQWCQKLKKEDWNHTGYHFVPGREEETQQAPPIPRQQEAYQSPVVLGCVPGWISNPQHKTEPVPLDPTVQAERDRLDAETRGRVRQMMIDAGLNDPAVPSPAAIQPQEPAPKKKTLGYDAAAIAVQLANIQGIPTPSQIAREE